MRYQITITGILDTSFSEDTIRRDFPGFASALAEVHPDAVHDSITLVSVEALPEPEPVTAVQEDTVDLTAMIRALHGTVAALADRVDSLTAGRE